MSGLPDDGEDLFGFLYRKVFSPGEERNHLGQRPVEVGVQYRRNNRLGVLFFGNERVVFVTFAPFRTSDVAFVLEYFDESGDGRIFRFGLLHCGDEIIDGTCAQLPEDLHDLFFAACQFFEGGIVCFHCVFIGLLQFSTKILDVQINLLKN